MNGFEEPGFNEYISNTEMRLQRTNACSDSEVIECSIGDVSTEQ